MTDRQRIPNRSHKWWGYCKLMIRAYGVLTVEEARDETERQELLAVKRAIDKTLTRRDGTDRLWLVNLVFWQRSCNLVGAARRLHISEVTAQRWHGAFIRAVAEEYGLIRQDGDSAFRDGDEVES